jgi:hypothetical protein
MKPPHLVMVTEHMPFSLHQVLYSGVGDMDRKRIVAVSQDIARWAGQEEEYKEGRSRRGGGLAGHTCKQARACGARAAGRPAPLAACPPSRQGLHLPAQQAAGHRGRQAGGRVGPRVASRQGVCPHAEPSSA